MQQLIEIIKDKNRIMAKADIKPQYLTDGLKIHYGDADVLVFPKSTQEISAIMSYANQYGINVTTRGAGTNLVGSTIPNGGIILDLSLMNKIIELDNNTFTMTVQSGILLNDVQQYAEQHNLFYPPDPGEKQSTIGGNISTNAGGMRAVKYGVTRDYVQALTVVLADGTILTIGSKNIKDNTGIALKHLFIGSEGTLGIVTQCTLKLMVKPNIAQTIVVGFHSIEAAIENVTLILETLTPTALEFVEQKVIKWGENYSGFTFPLPDAKAYLIIMLDGDNSLAVEQQRKNLLSTLTNASHTIPTPEQSAQIWAIRSSLVRAVEAVTSQDPVDIVVPINKLAEFVNFTKQLEIETGVRMLAFGHAGDGNVHLCILRDKLSEHEWVKKLHDVHTQLYQKCHELKGLPSAEHGIGTAKIDYFNAAIPLENRLKMQQIKQIFDPNHILNNQIYTKPLPK